MSILNFDITHNIPKQNNNLIKIFNITKQNTFSIKLLKMV